MKTKEQEEVLPSVWYWSCPEKEGTAEDYEIIFREQMRDYRRSKKKEKYVI